jgi:esterase/lipase superfamily enzyme
VASTEAESRVEAAAGADSPAETEKPMFSVVPVYFGTDRARMPDEKRLKFGLERARKLELGQALVSVPSAHEVPQIERPWSVRIPYFDVKIYEEAEDPSKHFTMREMRSLTREEFLALVKERLKSSSRFKDQAFIFVHGFNTTFDNAVFRTAQIAHDLKFDGAPFLYSWPSGGGFASYTYDRESSGQSEPFMREFMELVVSQSGAKAVSVIAHSMGNQPVLQVLRDLRRVKPNVVIDQIILAAPDVDRDNFENIAKEIGGLAKGITLYVAANDRALGVSRRFHGGVPRAGDVPSGGPLVLPGVDTIDVTAVSTDSLGINHSGYAESNALLNDIGLLIQTGERPPDKRIPILSKVPTPNGDYWKYPIAP